MWMAKLTYPWLLFLLAYNVHVVWVILCGRCAMLIYDQCSKGWHMGCLTLPWEKILIGKWFYL
jgi:hypothetical protein